MYKVVLHVPGSYSDAVREIVGSPVRDFSLPGEDDGDPEETIEFLCHKDHLSRIVEQIKTVYPDDEISLDIYRLESMHD